MELNFLLEAISGPEVVALAALMVANVLLSIIAAISKNVFSFRNLGDFVHTRLWPFIGYLVVAALGEFVDGWTAAVIAVYIGLVAMYGSGIAAAIKSLTGIQIPNIFSEKRQ